MLISCPECEKQISDRARACPGCGFPISEHLAVEAEERAVEEERASRRKVGEVDCVVCDARGYSMFDQENDSGEVRQAFSWCQICEHSGRVTLCQSSAGYFAVSYRKLDEFLRGAIDTVGDDVSSLGPQRPDGHRYPKAGVRKKASQTDSSNDENSGGE